MSTTEATQNVAAPVAPVRDIFNKPIAERDMIVYATRQKSETFLNKLLVTSVTPKAIKGFNPDDVHRRMRNITNFSTVAKVS